MIPSKYWHLVGMSMWGSLCVHELYLMVGHWCLVIHWFSHKARVHVKNGWFRAIKVASRLSRCHVHTLMFKVGLFYFIFNHLQPQNRSPRRLWLIWDTHVSPWGSVIVWINTMPNNIDTRVSLRECEGYCLECKPGWYYKQKYLQIPSNKNPRYR